VGTRAAGHVQGDRGLGAEARRQGVGTGQGVQGPFQALFGATAAKPVVELGQCLLRLGGGGRGRQIHAGSSRSVLAIGAWRRSFSGMSTTSVRSRKSPKPSSGSREAA